MSSGFGVRGTVGRCYPFWSAFEKCLATTEDGKACLDFRDDYVECLHHRKEFKRAKAIEEEKKLAESGLAGDHHHGGHH